MSKATYAPRMPLSKTARILLVLFVLVVNVGCDRATKSMARAAIAENERIALCHDHLTLMRMENTGAFLSLGAGLSGTARGWVFAILPLLFLGGGVGWLLTRQRMAASVIWGMGCVVGGGIGNVIDRLMYGSVTDFLYLRFGMLHTGVFNAADMSIMTGVVILLVYAWRGTSSATYGRG